MVQSASDFHLLLLLLRLRLLPCRCATPALSAAQQQRVNRQVARAMAKMSSEAFAASTSSINIKTYFHIITNTTGNGNVTTGQVEA